MKIKYIIFLMTLLLNSNSFSQNLKNYYQTINRADSLLYLEEDTSAYIKTIAQLKNRLFDEEYALFKMYLTIGDTSNSLKFAVKCYEKGAALDMFSGVYNQKSFAIFLKKMKQSNLNYSKNKNVSLDFVYSVYEMLGKDQLIRNLYNDSLVNVDECRKVDSTNLITLMNLIDTYGFPTVKDYGSQFYPFSILMLHLPFLDEQIYQRFLEFYISNLTKGAISPDLLAYFIDRHDYDKFGGQTYGMFANPYEGKGKIINEKDIDKRRSELYLPSMKIWLAKIGVKE